jgi:hypothetical protein
MYTEAEDGLEVDAQVAKLAALWILRGTRKPLGRSRRDTAWRPSWAKRDGNANTATLINTPADSAGWVDVWCLHGIFSRLVLAKNDAARC